MKPAIVHSFDKPLIIEDVPRPTPGSGEIDVKIHADCVISLSTFAALLKSVARNNKHPVEPEVEFTHFDLSFASLIARMSLCFLNEQV
jgi:NADPH:quinone reductase-like Zn-dependent oxidoreductase